MGDLLCTADFKTTFNEGDSRNYSWNLFTIAEIIHNTIPYIELNIYLRDINKNLLKPMEIALEENNNVMNKLGLLNWKFEKNFSHFLLQWNMIY